MTPLETTLGAVVRGVRLAALSDAEMTAIETAFLEHAVLVFPDQHLTEDEQRAFGARIGPIEEVTRTTTTAITNQRRDGSLMPAHDPIMHILKGNEDWHSDSSYMPVSAKASMLSAHIVPKVGGTTQWADMRHAFDTLDDDTKQRVLSLSAYHSIIRSQALLGFTDAPKGVYGYDITDPPLRPLVKHHPETGRPALFIGRHAYGIPGLAEDESERLLGDLLAHACQPPRVYEHHWTPGDLVMWDNRCVLHRARPWDLDEPRLMKHTRISGNPATEGTNSTNETI